MEAGPVLYFIALKGETLEFLELFELCQVIALEFIVDQLEFDEAVDVWEVLEGFELAIVEAEGYF